MFVLELLLLRTPVTPKLYSSCILVVKSSTTCRLRLMWRPNGRASDLQMAKRYYLIGNVVGAMVEPDFEPHKRSSHRAREFNQRPDLQCHPTQLPILDSASGLLQKRGD